jgi:hypothetical protein
MFNAPRKFKIKYKNIEAFERQIVDHTATTESCRDVTYWKDTFKDEPNAPQALVSSGIPAIINRRPAGSAGVPADVSRDSLKVRG